MCRKKEGEEEEEEDDDLKHFASRLTDRVLQLVKMDSRLIHHRWIVTAIVAASITHSKLDESQLPRV